MNFTKDGKIHGESNVWSAAQRQKKIYGCDVHAGLEGNYGSVGYSKQCSLVWSFVEERGWSCLMILDFEVEGQMKKGRPKRTWKRQVEEERVKIGLRIKDALCRSMWSVGVLLYSAVCCIC